jgi:HlyD family secretion protein
MLKKSSLKISIITLLSTALLLSGCVGARSGGTTAAATSIGQVSTISVTDTIDTSGSLNADLLSNLKWQTSGVVGSINVKTGDKVKAGDILAMLKSDTVPANIINAQSELVNARRNLDNLLNSQLSTAQAQANLANAKDKLDSMETKRQSKSYARASDAVYEETYANYIMAKDQAKQWEERYDAVDHLSEDNPIRAGALAEWAAAKHRLDTAEANLRYIESKPDDVEIAIADGNLALAQAQYDDALREWERLKDGPTSDDILVAQARIDSAISTVNNMYIIAPFTGEVLAIESSIGGQVNNGELALVITDRNTLNVNTLVDELDIVKVNLGNPVEITLDAIPDLVLEGTVSAINPVGSSVNGLVKYPVTIKLDNNDAPLYFGATTNVTILVSEPQDQMAVPLNAVQNDSEGEYVLRMLSDGTTERVAIVSYDLIGDLVTITGNLKVGDQLQLKTPSNQIQGGPGGMFGG